ncbi:MEDS domain-containing protein [Actinacidiphila glaucinigra]|uniref:MEDS domain-containing protein n=1 Tax=Actinacidiphila glaucinigra TaxID=235986 RepID=UPI0033ED2670
MPAADVRVVPVQRMRPGDHAFVSYDGDDTRWDVLAAFARLGLAAGERVMVFAAPGVPDPEVLAHLGPADDAGRPGDADAWVRSARRSGQLVLSSMRELISPEDEFTAVRQQGRLTEETDRAVRDGYAGLRAYIDMHWVRDLGAPIDAMVHRETHADHLFAGRPYAEVCAYDRRWFAGDVLDAMAQAHPRNLLARLGALYATRTEGRLRLLGEADLGTRERFHGVVADTLRRTAEGGHLVLALRDLHFLDVGCAAELLTLVAAAGERGVRVEVRCSAFHLALLRRLGAAALPGLTLIGVSG